MGGLIGLVDTNKDGLMSKDESVKTFRKGVSRKASLFINTSYAGQVFFGLLNLSGVDGNTATIIIAVNKWNETKVFTSKLNGTIPGSMKLSYKIESSGGINIYVNTNDYILIILKPITPTVTASISEVASVPSDAINIVL